MLCKKSGAEGQTRCPLPGLDNISSRGAYLLAVVLLALSGILVFRPRIVHAEDLGYSWPTDLEAPCEFKYGGPSCTNPDPGMIGDKYNWGIYDTNGVFHKYRSGYQYRNCTDYVQWREAQVGATIASNLGNAGDWYKATPTSEQTTTPKAWDVALVPATTTNPAGHVAFVESVDTDGTITISEYNHDTQGHGDMRRGKPADLGLTHFIDLGKHPDSLSTSPPANPTTAISSQQTPDGNEHIYWATADGILRETWFNASQGAHTNLIKKFGSTITALSSQYTASDMMQHVYAGTASGDIAEFWFGPGTGGYQGRVITNVGASITALSSQLAAGYTQHIYEASGNRILDTWWNSGQGATYVRDNESNSAIQGLTTQVTADGTTHIYWGNNEGRLHERYLLASGNTSLNVMAQFHRPITSLSSQTTPDGTQHIYSATDDGIIRETWFNPGLPGSGYSSWETAHINGTVYSLTSQYTTSDGTQHIFSAAADGNLSETWFRPGAVNGWRIPLNPGPGNITTITSQYGTDGTMHIFWGGSDGQVRETWLKPGIVNTWQVPGT